ncbi:MAG TPA: LON peptidase substrate-binding domain-containing protein [Steroidobacteraceae bacterium]|jgi:Lon protease-like protein|nr:LON peptidase substrate-binding domain-containing protein [Steroidobacteraceae bacterium]
MSRATQTAPTRATRAAHPADIPLFPLNTVLFPGGPLPLRIFEPRYVDMVRYCMREHAPFGVVLIRAGFEAGGAVTSTAEVGTSARIVDFFQMPDGLLGIRCVGERKFKVLERRVRSDGLNMGTVEWTPDERVAALPAEYSHLAALLRKVLPELGEIYESVPKHFDDAGWVSARLAEILPIHLAEKQLCLELADPLERLARLAPFIRRAEE